MATLVIGAGTAGIAAAHELSNAGVNVLVVEARDRIGGRVWTSDTFAPHPVEFGAEFIHGDNAPSWLYARRSGLTAYFWHKTDDSLVRLADGKLLTMAAARAQHPDFDVTRAWQLPDAPPPFESESLHAYLTRIGFTDAQLSYTRRSFANASGDSPHNISAIAAAEEWTDTTAGDGDYRLLEGYIHMLNDLARGLDIRLKTVVQSITWSDDGVVVTCDTGEVFMGDSAIITLPVGVLQSGSITFAPALPASKQAAIDALRMGPGMKLVYWFSEPVLPAGIGALYSAGTPAMWWSPSAGRDVQGQAITALATGDYARELAALGEQGALDFALRTLQDELGRPNLQPVAARWVHWTADPFALGVYSIVPPGAHDARLALGMPTPPLFWAGEATVKNAWGATVHGALVSGQRAAAQTLQFLQRQSVSA